MKVVSRIVREPLVQFVLIGVAVFGAYALFAKEESSPPRDQIIVTEGRVKQLAQIFAKTWQRPPTPQEMRGLLDAFIKEEVYYREAVKLGLDRDDTLIRRRMQQKMEFLTEPDAAALAEDDGALQAYLKANRAAYRVEPKFAFEQVFIKTNAAGGDAKARAAQVLKALQAGEAATGLGDATLLPPQVSLSPLRTIENDFGGDFAAALTEAPLNVWTGPVSSAYGLHLVKVSERVDGYDPKLEEVREAVARDWRARKRRHLQAEAYAKLRAKYEVMFPTAPAGKPKAEQAKEPAK